MEQSQSKNDHLKQDLYKQIAIRTGVDAAEVKKVMEVLNINKNFDEAAKLLGGAPALSHVFIGFRVSGGTIPV